MSCKHHLPGFKASCVGVGLLHVLLGGSVLLRGGAASLAEFGVPGSTVASPHYADAIWWVYSHMVVIGSMTVVVGLFAQSLALQRWFARLMLLAHAYYLVLDVRASDSAWGTGLYQGPRSIAPALIAFVMMLVFAHVSLCRELPGVRSDS